MKELNIYEYQVKHIEDTLRLVANTLGSRTEKTCLDRQVMKAIKMINEVITIDKAKIS